MATDLAMNASSTRVRIYVGTIFGLCVIVAAFVLGITALRPEAEDGNIPLITIVVGIFAPIVTALLAAALKENHDAMNSRLTQLLALTETAAEAKGALGAGVSAVDLAAVTAQQSERYGAALEQIGRNTQTTADNTTREVKP